MRSAAGARPQERRWSTSALALAGTAGYSRRAAMARCLFGYWLGGALASAWARMRRWGQTRIPPLSGDIHIAYQVVGDGPFDLVFVPGFVTHVELQWRLPNFPGFLTELGSFSRLIRFDKR